jgi:hypothetical protein
MLFNNDFRKNRYRTAHAGRRSAVPASQWEGAVAHKNMLFMGDGAFPSALAVSANSDSEKRASFGKKWQKTKVELRLVA